MMAPRAVAALAVVFSVVGRGWLHLRDPVHAHGYDGWYYVLHVRSLLEGEALFADSSWAFAPMVAMSWLTGDAVVGIAVVAVVSGGASTALAWWAASRLGGAWAGALGAWIAAVSAGHLALSAEFLKNGVGAVPLMGLLVWLAHDRAQEVPWRRAAGALALVALAGAVHKLCGVFALGLLVAWAAGRALGPRGDGRWAWMLLGAAGAALVLAGTLRGVDLQRGVEAVDADRWSRIRASSLGVPARVELAVLHAAPLLLPWVRGRGFGWLAASVGLVGLSVAPGLPFDFESVAWRLMCMGWVGLVALAGLLRAPAAVALPLCGWLAFHGATTVQGQSRRSPDYQAFRPWLAVVQEHVPADGLLVAHRGLCGFLWAEGERRCENFEPDHSGPGVWRVAYGVDPQRLEPYGKVRPLAPAYVLVEESVWRSFRAEQDPRSVVFGRRNPSEPRPAWVYGPRSPEGPTPR